MKSLIFILLSVALPAAPAPPRRSTVAKRKSTTPVRVSAAARQAARDEIERRLAGVEAGLENQQALALYYAALNQSRNGGPPVHILQWGDSHTASDDWVNTMRTAFQARYGNGGPGFVHAGHPFRGYRRFDASGTQSPGWKTEGVMALRGDEFQGFGGLSITARTSGQTVTLKATGELLEIFYQQQPGGGAFEIGIDEQQPGTVETAGETGPGVYSRALPAGEHNVTLRTVSRAPVRLFGFTLENVSGMTLEMLGINGAQANVMLGWNEEEWRAFTTRRNPSLVILAYGTNEANGRLWTAGKYRMELTEVIDRIRAAAPQASILMVGPPDCGKIKPLLHLAEVIDVQREVALAQGAAFWDWRLHMGGPGIVKQWVTAGLSQSDYIHLTAEGYRKIGQMLFAQLEAANTGTDAAHE